MNDSWPAFSPLSAAERRELLWLARESIRAALAAEGPPSCTLHTAGLDAPGGVFVSLHQARQLRGCIGTIISDRPLHEAVARMAVSAACDDPRFPPLALAELAGTVIEISRLSPLHPGRPEMIVLGTHGICVVHGPHRGVFLPQVATRYHWDRETLLTELCRKAMLPADSWKSPETTLLLFEAEVFSEE